MPTEGGLVLIQAEICWWWRNMAPLSGPMILCYFALRWLYPNRWDRKHVVLIATRWWTNIWEPHSRGTERKSSYYQPLYQNCGCMEPFFISSFAFSSGDLSWRSPSCSRHGHAFITLSLAQPACLCASETVSLGLAVLWSPPANAEPCSQDRHFMQRDETCSDSRFAPRVHYQRLAVKFLICLQLKCSGVHPQLGKNISSPLLISRFHRAHWLNVPLWFVLH